MRYKEKEKEEERKHYSLHDSAKWPTSTRQAQKTIFSHTPFMIVKYNKIYIYNRITYKSKK